MWVVVSSRGYMICCPAQLQWDLLRFSIRDHLLPFMLTCRFLALPQPVFYKDRLKFLLLCSTHDWVRICSSLPVRKFIHAANPNISTSVYFYVHHGPCRSLVVCPLSPQTTVMSQVEKKAGLLRRTSSSKKPLKEKVVLMYDDIFSVSIKRGRWSRKREIKIYSVCVFVWL